MRMPHQFSYPSLSAIAIQINMMATMLTNGMRQRMNQTTSFCASFTMSQRLSRGTHANYAGSSPSFWAILIRQTAANT